MPNTEKEKFIVMLEVLNVHPEFQLGLLLIYSTHKTLCMCTSVHPVDLGTAEMKIRQ